MKKGRKKKQLQHHRCMSSSQWCLQLATDNRLERIRKLQVMQKYKTLKCISLTLTYKLTVLKERMANRLAIMVENPGAKQLCAMNPSFSSARHITSSPCFQSQDGMFRRQACQQQLLSSNYNYQEFYPPINYIYLQFIYWHCQQLILHSI